MSVVKIGNKIKITKSPSCSLLFYCFTIYESYYDRHDCNRHHRHRHHHRHHVQREDLGIKGTFCLSLRGLGLLSIAHNHHRRHNQANLNHNFVPKKHHPRWMIHRRQKVGWIRLRFDL